MDDYNPNNAGAGGYMATSACGCTSGWTGELDREGIEYVIGWLRAGCTLVSLTADQRITRTICDQHKAPETTKEKK